MNISVIGCGRWGSFISWYLKDIGNDVLIYGIEGAPSYESLKNTRQNEYITVQQDMKFTSDLNEALDHAEIIVVSIGAQGFPALVEQLAMTSPDAKNKKYVLCMKGIIEGSGMRLSEVVANGLGAETKCAVWLGPGHPQDFIKGIPNCMTICSADLSYAKELCEKFSSSLIRFYYSTDLIGCELGGASKNVMGIAAGILDGMGYTSLKGALMARGPREMARLTTAMGGDERSIFGLCHIGDYEATLFSAHSHNRYFGEAFIKKITFDKLAEGVYTVRSLLTLGERYGVELPICSAVNDIIHNGREPKDALTTLFLRDLISEF